jgi:hypothetical protein
LAIDKDKIGGGLREREASSFREENDAAMLHA